jgi:hypothetical protein
MIDKSCRIAGDPLPFYPFYQQKNSSGLEDETIESSWVT